ncbi:hypothetical protein QQP08_010354, partial [Theobroma cacao]
MPTLFIVAGERDDIRNKQFICDEFYFFKDRHWLTPRSHLTCVRFEDGCSSATVLIPANIAINVLI